MLDILFFFHFQSPLSLCMCLSLRSDWFRDQVSQSGIQTLSTSFQRLSTALLNERANEGRSVMFGRPLRSDTLDLHRD